MNYNLLEEGWIPVLYRDGIVKRVNILEAFTQANRIREIAASNPMDRVAILRFLLALLYWCQVRPPEDNDGISSFPADSFKRLEDKKQCFNLFAEEKSFYQDHNAGGVAVPATKLLHDLPSGTNIAHFRHLRDFRDGICPGCCAMGLLRWSAFATASKKGPKEQMTAGLHGNTPAYTVRSGANLSQTLRLNRAAGKPVDGNVPAWDGATEDSPLGVLKNLTWQSRRVLLAAPCVDGHRDFSVGNCCYCDAFTDHLVKSILFRPGWQRPSKEPWWADSHLLWTDTTDKKGKAKKAIVRSAGPDDPLETHASVWRSVWEGLRRSGAGEFHTTLVSASQELYKDAKTHVASLPALDAAADELLMEEKQWLRQLVQRTVSARTADSKRPKGHVVVDAMCSSAAKGRAVRASLCAASFLAENQMERAFAKLANDLASCDAIDVGRRAALRTEFREEVGKILRQNVGWVADITARGSPLRRREAKDRATSAVRRAETLVSHEKEIPKP